MTTAEEFKQFNRPLIEEFRANAGKVEGWGSLLLLTTIGAKSGQPHTTPLVHSVDGDRMIVLAAARGAPRHPAWYHNLVAHPEVTVEYTGEILRMRATAAQGQEYERLYKQHIEKFPAVAEYQEMTTRQVPIVILARLD